MEPTRCFVVEAAYAPDADERRGPHRQAHLDRIETLRGDGVVALAGAYSDLSASLLVFAVDSAEAAGDLCHADVYWREGIWVDLTVRPFTRVA